MFTNLTSKNRLGYNRQRPLQSTIYRRLLCVLKISHLIESPYLPIYTYAPRGQIKNCNVALQSAPNILSSHESFWRFVDIFHIGYEIAIVDSPTLRPMMKYVICFLYKSSKSSRTGRNGVAFDLRETETHMTRFFSVTSAAPPALNRSCRGCRAATAPRARCKRLN